MRLLLCLAATVAVCQAARIPRGVDEAFPNFHAVHHGHGATSYQNVQIESYGSVPVPTEDHHHQQQLQQQHQHQYHHEVEHHATDVQEEPHHAHHRGHHEVSSVAVLPEVEKYQHLQHFIIVAKDLHDVSPANEGPVAENHQNLQQYITLEQNHQDVPSTDDSHENVQHYITFEQVPYTDNEIQHVESHGTSQLHYYGDNYEHDREYEYH